MTSDAVTKSPEQIHRGQTRIAYLLAANYAHVLMWVHGTSTGWHYYDGKRWAEDNRGVAVQSVAALLRTCLSDSLDDPELRKDVRRCESSAGIRGVLEIAQALPEFAHTIDDLDVDAHLLNTQSGTLDLNEMQLRPHDPRDRITKVTEAAYRPDRVSLVWQKFLETSLPDPDVRDFLQRYLGLALLGEVREHLLCLLVGTGRNGKSVCANAFGHALGDYAISVEPELFLERGSHSTTGELDLRGVRWAVVNETDEGRKLAAATLKRLVGGDAVRARALYRDHVEFIPSHTAAMLSNYLPRVSGDDEAVWARLRVVPWEVVIPPEEQDHNLGKKLKADRDAILTWIVEGWTKYDRCGGLTAPPAVLAATGAYKADQDPIGRFIAERCVTGPLVSSGAGPLYDAWVAYAAEEQTNPGSKRAFGQALEKRGHTARKGTGGARIREGIGLVFDED